MTDKIKGLTLIPEGTESYLNQRQIEDYKRHRRYKEASFLVSPDPAEVFSLTIEDLLAKCH